MTVPKYKQNSDKIQLILCHETDGMINCLHFALPQKQGLSLKVLVPARGEFEAEGGVMALVSSLFLTLFIADDFLLFLLFLVEPLISKCVNPE